MDPTAESQGICRPGDFKKGLVTLSDTNNLIQPVLGSMVLLLPLSIFFCYIAPIWAYSSDSNNYNPAIEGQNLLLNCTDDSYDSGFTLKNWVLPDLRVINDTQGKFRLDNDAETLTIKDINQEDTGTYICEGTDNGSPVKRPLKVPVPKPGRGGGR